MTHAEIALRPARAGDRAALLAVWLAAWRAARPEIDFAGRLAWFEAHLDTLAEAGADTVVAESEGVPVGFVTVDAGRRHLDQLAVHPAHGRTGIAARLIAAAKALSPRGLELDVNTDNAPARRLYARQGFSVVSAGTNPRSKLPTLRLRWRGDDP